MPLRRKPPRVSGPGWVSRVWGSISKGHPACKHLSHGDTECLMKAPVCLWRLLTVHPVVAADSSLTDLETDVHLNDTNENE